MTDPNGWPDASKPGVPLNPERSGAHWRSGIPSWWVSTSHMWRNWGDWVTPANAARSTYEGPCLAPTEVAAREAAAAEAMRAVCARAAMVEIGWNAAKAEVRKAIAMQAAHTVNAIRERPLPSPDALARLIADAEKRGMEKAAGIAEGLRDGNVEAIARCDWWGAQVAAAIRAAAKEPSNA